MPPAFSGRGGGRITSLQARDAGGRGGGGRGRGRGRGFKKTLNGNFMGDRDKPGESAAATESGEKLRQAKEDDALEAALGFPLFTAGDDRLGWLMNITPSVEENQANGQVMSAVDCYFMCQDGSMFKARRVFAPYFYLMVKEGSEAEVEAWMRRKFEGCIKDVLIVMREDLDLKNHLSGLQRQLLQVFFWNSSQLTDCRRDLVGTIARNKAKAGTGAAYARAGESYGAPLQMQDVAENLLDMREYDVPYHWRFAIDCDVRCANWYTVSCQDGVASLHYEKELLQRGEPRICAWDIETTKLPLKFPNAEYDQVFMISYMLDRQGYLIVNREVVGADVTDFEYTPKPEFEGPFIVVNVADEKALLTHWFRHMRQAKPAIYVTYNGDFFDFPFVETRAAKHGLDMHAELGFRNKGGKDGGPGAATQETTSRSAVHMDCMHWVNRDSYLPQGSRGLKAVTKAKLGYDPVEVHPEDMMRQAAEAPQAFASYSVSDAVSTYYLYMTYIHPFVFSLATIIPMPPDEVLRKGSGTLCEQLLVVQAFKANVVCPNKHHSASEVMFNGHLLESETYIGGKVAAIESGVFRADLPLKFKCKPQAYQMLIDNLDTDLAYTIDKEMRMTVADVANYDDVRSAILAKLESLRDCPNRDETPLIYHLDVAAMYPNIILTNRLQPSALVTDEDCAACDFNRPDRTCLRQMEWVWRGEHFSATRNEYISIKNQLASETFPPAKPAPAGRFGGFGKRFGAAAAGGGEEEEAPTMRYWTDLTSDEQAKLIKERLKMYSQKVYKRVLDKPVVEKRTAGICQRENSFYVDTVRDFRDRRYTYKNLNKEWKRKYEDARASGNPLRIQEAGDMCVLYESLQLAHKCILNSFYGYVMRRGARWYSMEMAGVVTNTGAKIIDDAHELVAQLGRPLELDTDGIWCALPGSFPEEFKLTSNAGKSHKISYPGVILNVRVAEKNTNEQYQTLIKDPAAAAAAGGAAGGSGAGGGGPAISRSLPKYETSSEMSIEFEVDGPYKAMILPASKEEGKNIKKRYAVFNFDGSLAELKGFEIKRRGELKLIKVFQAEVFEKFLAGETLQECYGAVAAVANRWLDMLDTQGMDLTDGELLDYISEATTMSKSMEEYEGRKSCAITTAKRLGAFLGDERIKEAGLNCTYVIARRPDNLPTSDRAIPISIFSAETAVQRAFLRKWCGEVGGQAGEKPDVRDIVDWAYYRERLSGTIMKIITIPAAMQQIANPVPRVKHPEWLHKKLRELSDKFQQRKIDGLLMRKEKPAAAAAAGATGDANAGDGSAAAGETSARLAGADVDMEDMGAGGMSTSRAAQALAGRSARAITRVASGTGSNGKENVPAPQVPAGPKPDMRADFKAWVAWQKAKWSGARQDRKRLREEAAKAAKQSARAGGRGAAAAAPAAAARGDVRAILQQRSAALTALPWHILQLVETATPGRFKMWFVADGRQLSVHLVIPRTMYIDSTLPPTADLASLCPILAQSRPVATAGGAAGRQLPGGRKAAHLYELCLPEADYRAVAARLAGELAGQHIRAVYEERMPLALHAALALGCSVSVTPAARGKSLTHDFSLRDFQMKSVTEMGYLDTPSADAAGPAAPGGTAEWDGLGPLRYAALYQSTDEAHSRGVSCLLMPAIGRAHIVVVTPFASAAHEVAPGAALDRAWRDALAAVLPSDKAQQDRLGGMQFSVEYVRDALDTAKLLQRALVAFRDQVRGPVVLLHQAPPGASGRLAGLVPVLAEFPTVDVPHHADDSKYPTLQWQQRAVRRSLHRVLHAGEWLRERLALVRYAHVPLANLAAGDTNLAVADVLLARNLRAAGHLLWVRDPALPDLGVEEPDEPAVALALAAPPTVEVVAPGAYRSISVELKMHHLAVCALMCADQVADLEGSATMDVGAGASAGAFRVLRGLVEAWIKDASVNRNPLADQLLQGLYRWVSSPASQLHDTGIQRCVTTLMHKLFMQLVAEMTKLGAVIIAANFNSITICTGKRNMKAAAAYTKYLLEALKRREQFNWLEMVPTRWWHVLLYRDAYNWGGIEAAVPPELGGVGTLADDEAEGADLKEPTVRYHWNLRDYLPPAVQEHLVEVLTEFIYLPWKAVQLKLEGRGAGGTADDAGAGVGAAGPGPSQGGSQAAVEAANAEDVLTSYLHTYVPDKLTERMLTLTLHMYKTMLPDSSVADYQFPRLAGSHLEMGELGTAALAFVRTACHLMELDSRCVDQVAVMRRQLLRQLHVGEFSVQAEFVEPCLSFTLHDVICSYCNDCRDLDLCRDNELQRGNWACRVCRQGQDKAAMEQRLVRAMQELVHGYQTQDLQCDKCRQVASGHLRSCCSFCSGSLVTVQPRWKLRKRVVVFSNLAHLHGFEVLGAAAGWMLADGRVAAAAAAAPT